MSVNRQVLVILTHPVRIAGVVFLEFMSFLYGCLEVIYSVLLGNLILGACLLAVHLQNPRYFYRDPCASSAQLPLQVGLGS